MTIRLVDETYLDKQRLVEELAKKHGYEPWRVRIFDMERASVRLVNPPVALIPPSLKQKFESATLIFQGNGFTFTTSETSSLRPDGSHMYTPYRAARELGSGDYLLQLTYDGEPVTEFDQLRLLDIMGRPSIYYFPFKDKPTGRPLPTYLVVNPYENCSYRCRPCSRLPFFHCTPHDYKDNVALIIREVLEQVDPIEVKFINIITGSQLTAALDMAMFRYIMDAFDAAGFSHCEYGVYTPNIESEADMRELRARRVVFFTATLETTTPEARARFYGPRNAKGRLTFEQIVALIRRAEGIFPYVNTNIMLGYESRDDLKRNLGVIVRDTKATINHFIPRIFLPSQYELIHPDARQLEYYIEMCAFIEREVNQGRESFGAFFNQRFGIPQFGLRFRS